MARHLASSLANSVIGCCSVRAPQAIGHTAWLRSGTSMSQGKNDGRLRPCMWVRSRPAHKKSPAGNGRRPARQKHHHTHHSLSAANTIAHARDANVLLIPGWALELILRSPVHASAEFPKRIWAGAQCVGPEPPDPCERVGTSPHPPTRDASPRRGYMYSTILFSNGCGMAFCEADAGAFPPGVAQRTQRGIRIEYSISLLGGPRARA